MLSGLDWSEVVIDRGMKMDALFAFDNAVEKLLAFVPIEPLPEQLAELRFLFEAELWREEVLSLEDELESGDNVERVPRDPGTTRG